MKTPATLLLLLVMAVAPGADGQTAAAPETAEQARREAPQGWPGAQLDAPARADDFLELQTGFQAATRDPDSSKFSEYRDHHAGAYIPFLWYERQDLVLRAFDLGRRDQRVFLGFDLGPWDIGVEYDEIPHFMGNDGRTLQQETARGVWEMSDTLQRVFQDTIANAVRANVTFPFLRDMVAPSYLASNVVDLHVQRKRLRVEGGYAERSDDGLPAPLNARVRFFQESRNGDKGVGGSFGFNNVVQVPEPVEYTTSVAGADVEFLVPQGLVRGGVRIDQFVNRVDSRWFDNPFRAVDATDASAHMAPGTASIAGPARGRIALQPDNRALYANVGGLLRLPANSRLTGDLVVGRMVQDQRLLPYTTNTAITTPLNASDPSTLPVRRFDGEIDTIAANLTFSSRPLPGLGIHARLRMYDLDNGSDRVTFPGYVRFDAAWAAVPRISVPYSWRNDRADLAATYDFGPVNVEAGVEHNRMERSFRDTRETEETLLRLAAGTRALDWLSARLTVESGTRDFDHYDPDRAELASFVQTRAATNHPLLRRFDQSKRDLTRLSAQLQMTPTEAIALTAHFSSQEEDYRDVPLGLQRARARALSLEGDYTPGGRWNAYAFVTGENWGSFQTGRQSGATPSTNPADDWSADIDTRGLSAGVGTNVQLRPEQLDLRVLARFQRINSFNDMETPPGGAPAIAVDVADFGDTNIAGISAELEYRLRQFLSVALGGWFERYRYRDAYSTGVTNYMPGAFLLAPIDEDYDGGAVYIRAIYRR